MISFKPLDGIWLFVAGQPIAITVESTKPTPRQTEPTIPAASAIAVRWHGRWNADVNAAAAATRNATSGAGSDRWSRTRPADAWVTVAKPAEPAPQANERPTWPWWPVHCPTIPECHRQGWCTDANTRSS